MAARNYPLDTKLQHFYHEQYDKETQARLDWYFKNKRGGQVDLMILLYIIFIIKYFKTH